MDDAGFWALIDKFDWARLGDDEAVCEPVVAALAELPPPQIHSFQAGYSLTPALIAYIHSVTE